MASLKELRDKRTEMGAHLSNLLRFVWHCYWKKKQKKKKKKKGKKGSKKKPNTSLSQTMVLPSRKNSTMVTSSGGLGKSPVSPSKPQKLVTVKDRE
mmetsp:Transcript_17376/g.21930  ORF Transcript_17376/g.21930 Transcript_17376/m.21930 type:complete len:96 (-) Transcript_17376:519-806(-)